MRVISQDGLIDVPYEISVFHIDFEISGATIRANIAGDTGKGTIIAHYSEEEKAKKAMSILHDSYTGECLFFIKNELPPEDRATLGDISWSQAIHETKCNGIISIIPKEYVETTWNNNIVFRFPKEEEL